MPPSSLRRAFLWSFLGFLGVTALIAIAVVVGGEFNDTMARVLGTTGSVSAGSVLAMACAAFRDRQQLAGAIGIALAVVATAMLVALLWRDRVDEGIGRATLLAVTYAVSVAHAELMLLGRLPARYRWVQRALVALIALMALMLTPVIYGWFDDHEGVARTLGVLAILIALGTLAVPVLLWISRSERAEAEAAALAAAGGPRAPLRRTLERQPDGSWRGDDGAVYELRRRR
jgi:hypothetical protein